MKQKSNKEKWDQEEILQAVVIADSFNERFLPISFEVPRCLMPLANVPLLEYTLDFLVAGGVQEVFVFCSTHSDKVRAHLDLIKAQGRFRGVQLTPIMSQECLSVGDALREIDQLSLIRSDFVLVSGDVVSNMKFDKVLEEHRKRKLVDKCSIMTMVLKLAEPGHRTRKLAGDTCIAMENKNNQLLAYHNNMGKKSAEFNLQMFSGANEVELRYDLLDAYISICTPDVPVLFSDNFDFQDRNDFIRGVLVDEILGNKIHVHVLKDEYAARVSNLKMYDAVTRDVLSRWAYPYTPDSNFSNAGLNFSRNHIYKPPPNKVDLARTSKLGSEVVIGRNTHVGKDSMVNCSIIGEGCIIGENVVIEDSYLWDNVIVGDNCIIRKSIVCENVSILDGVTIGKGCVLGQRTRVGPDVILKDNTMLTMAPGMQELPDGDLFDTIQMIIKRMGKEKTEQSKPSEWDSNIVGAKGQGRLFKPPKEILEMIEHVSLAYEPTHVTFSEDEEDSSDEDDEDEMINDLDQGYNQFFSEVLDSVRRGSVENIPTDNIVLEINGSKHAYNIPPAEVRHSVLLAIFDAAVQMPTLKEALKTAQRSVGKFAELMNNYFKTTSREDQMYFIRSLEQVYISHPVLKGGFGNLLHLCYNEDVLVEEVILMWYNAPDGSETGMKMRAESKTFVQWLEEAESESSEEEDSD
eukprot:Nk52_evm62s2657 gene=Nk52_evmTU62s2657